MAMQRVLQQAFKLPSLSYQCMRAMSTGDAGSGAGKGGGSGGSIRAAGGKLGEMEAAREEEYFRKLQAKQLKSIHDHIEDEVHHHQAEITRLEEELKRKQMKLDRLKADLSESK